MTLNKSEIVKRGCKFGGCCNGEAISEKINLGDVSTLLIQRLIGQHCIVSNEYEINVNTCIYLTLAA
jgi:hypothetical protein